MVRVTLKKLISALLVVVICLSVIPAFRFESVAANGVELRLDKLKKEYPHGWYYNHKVSAEGDKRENLLASRDERYSQKVTRYPCNDHKGKTAKGEYDCNYFDGGYQCHGFAARLFYEIFGIRQSKVEKSTKKLYSIKPGDLVRLKKGTHSAIVLSVNGLKFKVAECNVTSGGQTNTCAISWGREYKVSDITYFVRATNYDKVVADTAWKNIEDKQNKGSSFYGAIINTSNKKALTSDGKGGTAFKPYKATASQVWSFTRQKNGSYKIISCLDKKALTLKSTGSKLKGDVITAKTESSASQSWAFYGSDKKLYLSADSGTGVLLCGENAKGITDKKTSSALKQFTLKKEEQPQKAVVKVAATVGSVSCSWSAVKNATSYDIEIYSGKKIYKAERKIKGTSVKINLPEGNYSAKIISNNAFSSVNGNIVHFTVSDITNLGKPAKVSAKSTLSSIALSWTKVPGATGYRVYYKSGDKWKTGATVKTTTHTFSKLPSAKTYTFAVRAYGVYNKKTVWAKSKTEFSWATKPVKPASVKATQTASSVTLSWSAVAKADGYRIYKKTSEGWKSCGTFTARTATFKGLSAGQSVTYAVRPYIKTASGVVWGDYKSIKTATKPTAPKVTVSDVKNLGAKVRWNKVKGADGYQVFYKFDKTDYTLLSDYKATEGGVELNNLTYGVYYTFAVRAFKKVDGGYVYSPLTSVRFRAKYL